MQHVGDDSDGGTWSGGQPVTENAATSEDQGSSVIMAGATASVTEASAAVDSVDPSEVVRAGDATLLSSPVISSGARPSSPRERALNEREGFAGIKAVLPEHGEGLVMDMETLRNMRSQTNKVCKRSVPCFWETEWTR